MTALPQGDLPADPDVLRTMTKHNAVDTFATGTPYPCAGVYPRRDPWRTDHAGPARLHRVALGSRQQSGATGSARGWHPVVVGITFEPVRPDGAAALAKLKADTFVETFAADNDPAHVEAHLARAFTREGVERTLADERSTTWWLLDDGVPVGYLKVNRGGSQTEPDLDDGLELEQIYVSASHQGQGLGGRLLSHAIDTAASEGFSYLWLGVWERNLRAIAVYERRGFVPFGDHTFLFGDEEQRDILMRLDVRARGEGHGMPAVS